MLELKNITIEVIDSKNEKVKLLDDVSLTIEENSFFVITGPNGSGKSTLAKTIMGIQPVKSGKIFFKGKDITNMTVTERAQIGIGFAFQQPVRFKGLTVLDLLQLAAKNPVTTEQVCNYLSAVGLCAKDYLNRELNSTLSGGEMKRIEIAMQIARGSALAVFDEPEAGIDLWSFQNLISIFKEFKEKHKGTALIISHQERIINIADKVALLSHGRVEAVGSKDEIFEKLSPIGAKSCGLIGAKCNE